MTHQKIIEQTGSKNEVIYSSLLREKGGGVIEGKPLKLIADAAKISKTPIRSYRPEKGECWKDVYERAAETVKLIFFDKFVAQKQCRR